MENQSLDTDIDEILNETFSDVSKLGLRTVKRNGSLVNKLLP